MISSDDDGECREREWVCVVAWRAMQSTAKRSGSSSCYDVAYVMGSKGGRDEMMVGSGDICQYPLPPFAEKVRRRNWLGREQDQEHDSLPTSID